MGLDLHYFNKESVKRKTSEYDQKMPFILYLAVKSMRIKN